MHEYEYARVDEYSPYEYYTWCTTLVALVLYRILCILLQYYA